MNIRLNQDVRIRLDQEDVSRWKSNGHLEQKFKIGNLSFLIQINVDSASQKTYANYENEKVSIFLSEEDSGKISFDKLSEAGIFLDNLNIQVDRWSAEKRNKHESLVKDKQK